MNTPALDPPDEVDAAFGAGSFDQVLTELAAAGLEPVESAEVIQNYVDGNIILRLQTTDQRRWSMKLYIDPGREQAGRFQRGRNKPLAQLQHTFAFEAALIQAGADVARPVEFGTPPQPFLQLATPSPGVLQVHQWVNGQSMNDNTTRVRVPPAAFPNLGRNLGALHLVAARGGRSPITILNRGTETQYYFAKTWPMQPLDVYGRNEAVTTVTATVNKITDPRLRDLLRNLSAENNGYGLDDQTHWHETLDHPAKSTIVSADGNAAFIDLENRAILHLPTQAISYIEGSFDPNNSTAIAAVARYFQSYETAGNDLQPVREALHRMDAAWAAVQGIKAVTDVMHERGDRAEATKQALAKLETLQPGANLRNPEYQAMDKAIEMVLSQSIPPTNSRFLG